MRLILSVLGIIFFVVAVIFIIASGNSVKTPKSATNLTNYNNTTSYFTQTSTGPLVGDGQRQAIRIVISQSQRSIYLLSGYEQNVAASETFSNNSAAYSVFLGAMQNASYTNSRLTTQQNMFGVCPFGQTYQYQFNDSTKIITNTWSTNCNSSDGNFAGQGPSIRQLFTLQIPNYNAFTLSYSSAQF